LSSTVKVLYLDKKTILVFKASQITRYVHHLSLKHRQAKCLRKSCVFVAWRFFYCRSRFRAYFDVVLSLSLNGADLQASPVRVKTSLLL